MDNTRAINTLNEAFTSILSLAEKLSLSIPVGQTLLEVSLPLVFAPQSLQKRLFPLYNSLLKCDENSIKYRELLKNVYNLRFPASSFQDRKNITQYCHLALEIEPNFAFYLFNNVSKNIALELIINSLKTIQWNKDNHYLLSQINAIQQMLNPFISNSELILIDENLDFFKYLIIFWKNHIIPQRQAITSQAKNIPLSELFKEDNNKKQIKTNKSDLNNDYKEILKILDNISLALAKINLLLRY